MFNLTFQQIEVFLAVAKYQSLSKASETLFVSQPALSKTLQRFEENIGFSLFNRTNQGMELTQYGRFLYITLKPIYENMDKAIQSVKDLLGPEERYLHIAVPVMYDFCDAFEPVKRLIRRFQETYPSVQIMETVYELKDLQNSLQIGFVNLMVAPSFSLAKTQNIAMKRISDIKLYFAMSSDHPLAKLSALSVDTLIHEAFLAVPYAEEAYDKEVLLNQCRQNGFVPKSVDRPPNFQTVLHSIRCGRYLSVFWNLDYPDNHGKLRLFPVPTQTEPLNAVIAWRPDRISHTARDFIEMLLKN